MKANPENIIKQKTMNQSEEMQKAKRIMLELIKWEQNDYLNVVIRSLKDYYENLRFEAEQGAFTKEHLKEEKVVEFFEEKVNEVSPEPTGL